MQILPQVVEAPQASPVRRGKPAGYTQLPNRFLDWTLPLCDGSEAKVVLYIARRTLGTAKGREIGEAQIRIEQICHGWRGRDGELVDIGANIARATAVKAVAGLEAKGIIVRSSGRGRKADAYKISDAALDGRCNAEIAPSCGSGSEPLAVQDLNCKPALCGSEAEPKERKIRKKERKERLAAVSSGVELFKKMGSSSSGPAPIPPEQPSAKTDDDDEFPFLKIQPEKTSLPADAAAEGRLMKNLSERIRAAAENAVPPDRKILRDIVAHWRSRPDLQAVVEIGGRQSELWLIAITDWLHFVTEARLWGRATSSVYAMLRRDSEERAPDWSLDFPLSERLRTLKRQAENPIREQPAEVEEQPARTEAPIEYRKPEPPPCQKCKGFGLAKNLRCTCPAGANISDATLELANAKPRGAPDRRRRPLPPMPAQMITQQDFAGLGRWATA